MRAPWQRLACALCERRDLAATAMADADDVRRLGLALALPCLAELASDGFDFRVAGMGFIWSYPERKPGQAAADPDGHRGAVCR